MTDVEKIRMIRSALADAAINQVKIIVDESGSMPRIYEAVSKWAVLDNFVMELQLKREELDRAGEK